MTGNYSPGLQRTIREVREIILDLLDAAYPISTRESDLTEAMADATMPRPIPAEKVVKDLSYLAGLGLIEQELKPNPAGGRQVLRWNLASKGKRFCELNKPWDRVEEL